jgi:acetylornithine deacetylase/succinyl-diaminopimelate desuccinylase family protein
MGLYDFDTQIKKNINPKRLVELTKLLVQCDSIAPPGNEYQASMLLKKLLFHMKLDVSIQNVTEKRFNIIARLKGSGKSKTTVLYLGHIDVVPTGNESTWLFPPFSCAQKNGRLYGRGTCDMKGSIACAVHAIEAIQNSKITLDGDLIVALDVDEEVSNLGMKKIIAEGLKARYCVVGEPTNLEIAIGHRGVISFHVFFKGKAAHASQAQNGINAIYHALKFAEKIKELNQSLQSKTHSLLGTTTFNVTMIQGGIKTNTIPDQCELTVDCRLLPGETDQSCKKSIDNIIDDLTSADNTFNCFYRIDTYCAPGEINPKEKIIESLKQTIKKTLNIEPVIKGFEATCEASMVTDYLGIPAVIFGPGSIFQAHNSNEYIEIDQLVKGCEIYARLFVDMLLDE